MSIGHNQFSPRYDYGGTRVVALANEKGGVAKTTSCINLAAATARRGREVLCIDMDPQANATYGLGFDPTRIQHQPDLILTSERLPLERCIVRTDIPHLDLLPAESQLANCNKTLVAEVGRETRMRTKILQYSRTPNTKHYDYIFMDCSPSLDLITLNVLMAATDLIVPVQPRYYSLQGMSLVGQTLDSLYRQLDPQIRLLGILITLFDRSTALDEAIYELVQERVKRDFGDFLFGSVIPRNIAVSETEISNRPIVGREPTASASRAYEAVAEEMLSRIESGAWQPTVH
jgi:chromosome partitioning protein